MLLSFLGFKVAGLRRKRAFYVWISRLFARPAGSPQRMYSILFFLALSIYLLVLSRNEAAITLSVQARLMDMTAPLVHLLQKPLLWVKEKSYFFQSQESLQQEIFNLKKEKQQLLEWQTLAGKLKKENQYLKEILKVIPENPAHTITTKVLGIPNPQFLSSMVITASPQLGLHKNQVVICPEGVLGRIIEVGSLTARVMLITDINSRIPVRIQSTGEQAILAGQNTHELKVIHLNRTSSQGTNLAQIKSLKLGDRLLTSGYGGIYPPGIPVAVITKIEEHQVTASILANPTALEYATILKVENHETSSQ